MWLLSTKDRPGHLREAVTSFYRLGNPRMIIWQDRAGEGLTEQMNWVLETFPDEPSYGWLADDFRAKSQGWDKRLEKIAGTDRIAYGDDGCDRSADRRGVAPYYLTSGFCIGGDLVRAAGFWAPPWLRQAGIDTFWNRVGRAFKRMMYVRDVKIAHLHWRFGTRERDATDNLSDQEDRGRKATTALIEHPDYLPAIERIGKALNYPHMDRAIQIASG